MALSKDITLENGIVVNYHRIVALHSQVNHGTSLEIFHYTSEEWRDLERQGTSKNTNVSSEIIIVPYDPTMSVVTAYDYLKTLDKYANADDVFEHGQTGSVVDITPNWESGHVYKVGEQCVYEGSLYATIQMHISQDDWTPPLVPALFVLVKEYGPEPGPTPTIPEWVQPTGSTDAYMTGDHVMHNNMEWVSVADNNVWEPGVYGWNVVNGSE